MKYFTPILLTALFPALASAQGNGLTNPIVFGSLQGLLGALVSALIIMLIPIVVFFIIFAGFKYVTARGNPNDIQVANQALLYAVIGGVIILGATAIITIVGGTVNNFRSEATTSILLASNDI